MFIINKNYNFNTVSSVIGLTYSNVTILNMFGYEAAMKEDPNLETINSQICVARGIAITDIKMDTFIHFRNNTSGETKVFSLSWIDIDSIEESDDKVTLTVKISDLSAFDAEWVSQYIVGIGKGIIEIQKS